MKWKLAQLSAGHCPFLKYRRGLAGWRRWKAAPKDTTVGLMSRNLANIFLPSMQSEGN